MAEIAILVTKPKTLTRKARRALEDSGVVVIETDDPKSIRFITPQAELSGSELLAAALIAIDESALDGPKAKMVSVMRKMMEKGEQR